MVLEFRDVLIQRRGVCLVFLEDHSLGGEPSDSSFGDISLFEVFIELCNKVWVCSYGYVLVASTVFSRKVAAQVRADPLVI